MTWVFLVNPVPHRGRTRLPTAADARAVLESLGLSVVDFPPGSWPPASLPDDGLLEPTPPAAKVRMAAELAIASFAYWSRGWSMLRNRWQPALRIEPGPWLIRRGLQCSYETVELPLPANDLNGR
jgi:hypothetical protein